MQLLIGYCTEKQSQKIELCPAVEGGLGLELILNDEWLADVGPQEGGVGVEISIKNIIPEIGCGPFGHKKYSFQFGAFNFANGWNDEGNWWAGPCCFPIPVVNEGFNSTSVGTVEV